MKKLAAMGIGAAAALLPLFVFAQTGSVEVQDVDSEEGLFGIVKSLGNLIAVATPVVAGLAVLYFFWGLAEYVLNSGDEKKKEQGRNIMIWGTVALFIMVSVWGLVRALQDTFGLDPEQEIFIPRIAPEAGDAVNQGG
jgi:hypothetical protein